MSQKFTTKEKILVNLLEFYDMKERYPRPMEITQEGMAERLNSKQNTISYAVRDLVKNDLVYEETTRIKGKKQRRKGYFLTDKGVEKAKKTKKIIEQNPVEVMIGDEKKEVLMKEVNRYFHTNLSLLDIIARIEDGVLEFEEDKEKKTFNDYLYTLPEPPEEEPEGLDRLKDWWEGSGDLMMIEGENGTGKTTLITSFIQEVEGRCNIFYLPLEEWFIQRNLWEHLANFLSSSGEHKLSSYLEASNKLNLKEALSTLRMDIELLQEVLIVIEDLDKNPGIKELICDNIEYIRNIPNVNLLFTGEPGFCDERIVRRSDGEVIDLEWGECEKPFFVTLSEIYGLQESCDVVLDVILEGTLTSEEYWTLAYTSIHRIPVERKEIVRLKSLNMNILNNLLKTPLINMTSEEKPMVHPLVRKKIIERMTDEKKITLHTFAGEYYEKIPAKTVVEQIELLHHLSGSENEERFVDALDEFAPEIITSGYSGLMLKITGHAKGHISEDEKRGIISFWSGEAYRVMEEYGKALDRYENVMEKSDDARVITNTRHGIAMIMESRKQYESAIDEYERALDSAQRLGETGETLVGKTYLRLGEIWSKKGKYDRARRYLDSAVKILKKQENYSLLTSLYFLLARIEKESGNWERGLDHFKQGMEYWEKIDETYLRVGGLHDIGAFYKVIRELRNAEGFLRESIKTCEQFGYRQLKGSALLTLTECYLEKGDYEKAVKSAKEAKDIFTFLEREEEKAYAHSLLGQAYTKLDDLSKAEDDFNKAISIYQKMGSSYSLGLVYFSMAKLQEKKGNKEGIADNYRKALLSLSCSGADRIAEHVEREMKAMPLSM